MDWYVCLLYRPRAGYVAELCFHALASYFIFCASVSLLNSVLLDESFIALHKKAYFLNIENRVPEMAWPRTI